MRLLHPVTKKISYRIPKICDPVVEKKVKKKKNCGYKDFIGDNVTNWLMIIIKLLHGN